MYFRSCFRLWSKTVKLEEAANNLDIVAYIHVGVSLACLVVDLTLGVHFGMDYTTLTDQLALNSPILENYQTDSIRVGAFLLMTLSLKGYIGHAINLILLVLLIIQVVKYQNELNENEHPIRKLGVVSAFDPPRRFDDPRNAHRNDVLPAFSRGLSANHTHDDLPYYHNQTRENPLSFEDSNPPKRLEDPWQMNRNDNMFSGYPKRSQGGPHVNPAYEEEPSRPSPRENSLSDYNSRNAKRTDSWLHNQITSGPGLGSRPFSYLEEPKRPIPVKPPSMPVNEPQWRRDAWPPAPPVPDPDYSPPPRRLKSALKSNYP
ncbi:uncharacterized protein LOC123668841 [Melitaea cinxia]|uniref:uncharacterized protein LOC123668841 n=1 Tax=Melitaea cinxia TaxID=113334 RepID=UPI001E273EB4|nr:uncharacterized protein LOC123668841 [Melitaea cinxia]